MKKRNLLILIVLFLVIIFVVFMFSRNNITKKEQKKQEFNYNMTWEEIFGDPVYRQMILYQIMVDKNSPEYNMRDVNGKHVVTNSTLANMTIKEKQKVTEAELASVTELFPLTPENEKDNANYIPTGVKNAKEFNQVFFSSPFYYNCYLYNLTSIEVNTDKFTRELYPKYNYPKCLNLKKLKINNYGSTFLDLGFMGIAENFEIINHNKNYTTDVIIDTQSYIGYGYVKSIKAQGNFRLFKKSGALYSGFPANMRLDKFIIDGTTDDVVTAKETVAKTTKTEIRVDQDENPCKYTLSGDNLTKVEFGDSKTEICPEKSFIKLRDVPKLKNVEISSYAEFDYFDYENNHIEEAEISNNIKYNDRIINLKNNPLRLIRFDFYHDNTSNSKIFKELNLTVGYGKVLDFTSSTYGKTKTAFIVDDSNKEEYTEEEVNNLTPKSSVEGINGVFNVTKNIHADSYSFLELGPKTLKVLKLDNNTNKYIVNGIINVEVVKTSFASDYEPQYIVNKPKINIYQKENEGQYNCSSDYDPFGYRNIPIYNQENIGGVLNCAKNKKGFHTDGYREITFNDGSIKRFPLSYYGYELVKEKKDCKTLYSNNEAYILGDNNKVSLRNYDKIYDCIKNNENYTCTVKYEDNCSNYKLENTLLDSANYQKRWMKKEVNIPWYHIGITKKLIEGAIPTEKGVFNIHIFEPGKTILNNNEYLYKETTQTNTKNIEWKEGEEKRVISYVSYEDEDRTIEKDRFVVTTILRDTDGDKIPDVDDDDDDNDGISDEQEILDGTNPKDKTNKTVNICYKVKG